MPALSRAIPNRAERANDDSRHLPKTLYVDFAQLEERMSKQDAARLNRSAQVNRQPSRRITTVNDEVVGLRRNVRDAARCVLQWLAGVTQHGGQNDLDRVLDKCLRPGADTTAVNYTALADEINGALGTDLSPKRVQTAIRHLREAGSSQGKDTAAAPKRESEQYARFEALRVRLQDNHDSLVSAHDGGGHTLRRAVAHDVLGALRASAGRLIECGFGEGIPQHVDLDATQERFLAFIRRAIPTPPGSSGTPGSDQTPSTLHEDIDRLLKALKHHDDTPEADTQLVIAGVCVVADLIGPESLFGVMARLNLLMIGRPMLASEFFVGQLLALADTAGDLVHDRATQTDMAWVRLQPEDRRVPSPNRVRSYCLNNAATHILQRLHTGKLAGGQWFTTAQTCYDTMHRCDRGFALLKTTEAIMLCVLAELTGNTAPISAMFQQLGRVGSLNLLTDLARYDNSPELNQLVRTHADAVHEGIASQLLVLPG